MPDGRRRGKKARSKRSARTSSNQNLKFIALALLFAFITALFYQRRRSPSQTKDHDGDHKIFTVVHIPGKGKGLIAARDIKQGELVIRERPLFLMSQRLQTSPTALIAEKLKELGHEELEAFLNLSYVNFSSHLDPQLHPEEVAWAIFTTNAVAAGEGAVGVFPRMARINHGCVSTFNVVYTWRESEQALFLFALRDIRKGDEILTTYTDTRKPRDVRRAFLSSQYRFNCTCGVCSLPEALSKASDERLLEMTRRFKKVGTWGSEIGGGEAVQHIRKIWEIGEEEGYWSGRGQLAADATIISASHSDAIAAQAWARKAVEWYSYEVGADSTFVKDMSVFVEHPESHPAWGMAEKAKVGGPN